jgi:hypothetical protein
MIAVVAQHSGPLSFVYGGNSDELQLLDASGVVLAAQDLPTEVEFFTVGADTDLIVTPDGGVLVPYGNENNNVSGGPFAGVLRFNADLTPDATLPAAPPPAGLPAVKDVRGAAMPDGSVVFAAPLDPGPGGVVLKMQPDGSYDASFGGGGLLTVPEAGAPVAEPDGKFLIAGKSADGKTVVVRRFNADGTADASFGDGAAFTLDLTSLGGAAGEVSAQLSPDGTSLYVATSATAANSNATQVGGTAPRVGVLVRLNL